MNSDVADKKSLPVDFAVYGLDWGFRGPRWVDFFEGTPDGRPWALWLGHRQQESEHGVRIGTLPRPRYDETMCPNGGDPLAEVAFGGAFGLVNLTLPDGSVPRPDGLILALVEHAEKQAKRYEEWPQVTWRVEGEPVRARVWHFAGAWAGFTTELPDAYVVAIGIGLPPEETHLVRIDKTDSYGTDFGAPLSLTDLGKHKSNRPEAWLPPPQRDGFHPDQLALVPETEH
ncbi:hypothetical protein DI005_20485 [Prauserella sp. PE36]|uniref:DUF4262 domain-containing protein n=1 Tax=Prauserella endophytica TaxID=1592324 RepID=A0ABY2S5K8_9PSEU|nr:MULTISPECIES: hypothetical protein [Prauserella]PXY35188.1 hypothetical protein BAY59_01410 [Prauserella coralliicola]RBM18041.1 hypothetical protein DI005_20485 [Prauserella sp. PE36]TKG70071.1 hypothetical protein FCN18_18430 [Prauserella endophytica]